MARRRLFRGFGFCTRRNGLVDFEAWRIATWIDVNDDWIILAGPCVILSQTPPQAACIDPDDIMIVAIHVWWAPIDVFSNSFCKNLSRRVSEVLV